MDIVFNLHSMKALKVSGRRHVVEKCSNVKKMILALNKIKINCKKTTIDSLQKSMICTMYDVYFCLLLNSCVTLLQSETHLNFLLSNNKLCKTTKHIPMCWWELKNFKLAKTLTITSRFRAWCNNKLITWKYWHFQNIIL